jgi:hypothetical protein
MIRYALLSLLSFLLGLFCAQESRPAFSHEAFEEQALTYQPPQRVGVSEKDYAFGKMVLRETVRQTENDANTFNLADYFNVLSAFLTLREPEPALQLAFEKFINAPGSCEYLIEFWNKVKSNPKYAPIRKDWEQAKLDCENNEEPLAQSQSLEEYASEHRLDLELLRQIQELNERDQQYRKDKYQPTQQTPLDQQNERMIDSLYEAHGQYIGSKLVGDKFEHVMWSIIQHSQLATMERYLPIIKQAVQEGQLAETPFRMLIDRVYTAKTGRQVFGSQQGVELLPPAERERICREYGINP